MSAFIGSNLRQLRKEQGLTLRELAYELDMDHRDISKYENGKRKISDEKLEEFADYYGVSIEEIMYGVMR